ncbi:pilus assembly protein [Shewanella intestini]|uniref:rRNA (Guanine-N1)-methyltransferase n=1 Tax=Shewanella intestini TaxID=2017544 RepID=A0ABS5HYI3_9GAMM|nr:MULTISPECIES: PilC/PilY family type IV pilus protein [Shewanella]MBR9726696.1 rRNA (guanine-N1)-methyltransferase [Shewanella intestini]MRG34738.1 rRNA (guanine-N1)-methyltransferase [Shewanella sp. XMDDZSB0408]
MFLKQIFYTGVFVTLGSVAATIAPVMADDTELYVLESSVRSNDNPQVLIILDTSGSMDTDFTAPTFHSQQALTNSTKIFFSHDARLVPTASSNQYFTYDKNGCHVSKDFLGTYGTYTGYFRHYDGSKWVKYPLNDGSVINTVDCYEDIAEKVTTNTGGVTGYPVDELASPYDNDITKAELTEFGLGDPVYLFTKEYIDWFHQNNKPNGWANGDSYTRMDVAKRVLEEIIVNSPGVDFGLAIFNKNSKTSQDGGRIISGISANSIANKKSMIKSIDDSKSISGNYTPLCETLYEAYSYLYGQPVKFGHKTSGSNDNPSYDTSIENSAGNTYISPFVNKYCQSKASIIYVTDGIPNKDTSADTNIKALPGIDLTVGVDVKWDNKTTTNLLPSIAKWMYTNDVNSNIPGVQSVTTHTIGFSSGAADAAEILQATADNAGGKYYPANSAQELKASLLNVLAEINSKDASFSAPSVVLDKTQTGDAAYFAMFLPGKGPRWSGNLKKFKVAADGAVIDKNDKDAIDTSGSIAKEACPLWTVDCSGLDYAGYNVSDGGVAQILRDKYKTSVANRKVLVNTSSSGNLVTFNKTNIQQISNLNTDEKLSDFMGVTVDAIDSTLDWVRGVNVDAEPYSDDANATPPYLRQDIIGDPLHSRPLVINFGNETEPDVRILMGTNHGFMHMFKDTEKDGTGSVEESWAFMPSELLGNLKGLRDNPSTGVHSIYGIDSSPVSYLERDSNGKVSKAWVYFGMRRGGSSYYALDVSVPDSPKLKWIKSNDNYAVLGESWAEPVITKIAGWPAGALTASDAEPVLVIGAGYNATTKDGASVGADDTHGAGVVILAASSGQLIHQFGQSALGANTVMPGLTDSIPNKVAVLDSNNNQLTDRIYATDTGANIWRIDLPGLPTDTSNPWSAYKFASLGGNTTASDIRFFSEPVIAQTAFSNVTEHTYTDASGVSHTSSQYQNIPYDAVVVGSGHRPHPLNKARNDQFFVFQDRNIVSKSYSSASGNTTPSLLTISDLYNVTSESPTTEAELLAFGEKRGWYYNFADEGEKSLSAATIVQGRVFFTSYVPEIGATANACLIPGQGRLYGFDLHKGIRAYSHSEDYFDIGEQVPDTPTLIIPKNGDDDSYMYLIGIGDAANQMKKEESVIDDGCPAGDNSCVGGGLGVNQIYYHLHEI